MKYIVAVVAVLMSGCSHYGLISSERDAWIEQHAHGQDDKILYCRANPSTDGGMHPVCIEAFHAYRGSQYAVPPGTKLEPYEPKACVITPKPQ